MRPAFHSFLRIAHSYNSPPPKSSIGHRPLSFEETRVTGYSHTWWMVFLYVSTQMWMNWYILVALGCEISSCCFIVIVLIEPCFENFHALRSFAQKRGQLPCQHVHILFMTLFGFLKTEGTISVRCPPPYLAAISMAHQARGFAAVT